MACSIGRHLLSRSIVSRRPVPCHTPRVRFSTFEPLALPKARPVQPPTPPLSQRLKAIIPFLIWWTVITSLATNNLRLRTSSKEELDTRRAQITVLESLVDRLREGIHLLDDEVRRELEMVGLRERTSSTSQGEVSRGTADVGWSQALFGRTKTKTPDEEVKEVVAEWAQRMSHFYLFSGSRVCHELTCTTVMRVSSNTSSEPKPSPAVLQSGREGVARRAPSGGVYM